MGPGVEAGSSHQIWRVVPWGTGWVLTRFLHIPGARLGGHRLDPCPELVSQGSKGGMSTLTYF